tara:strand:- start:324 stop:1100 length:777 start_codon:yes stop_codon:yes gene_type:complete
MGKYFTVEVKPTIAGSAQLAAFSADDVLFDWTSFQVPRGANKLHAATIKMSGANGGQQDGAKIDVDLIFAKSINNIAPATIGTANTTVSAAPVVKNHILGMTRFTSGTDYGAEAFDYFLVGSTGSGGNASNKPDIVLKGDQDENNVGYDTLYIAGIAGNTGIDFGTTVITRGAITDDATVVVPTDAGSNDDPNADLIFAVGDVIHTGTDDVVGTISSIAAFGSSKQDITFTAGITADLADNEELLNINPIQIILSFEK